MVSSAFAEEVPARFSVVQWNIGHFAMGKDCFTAITAAESAARRTEYRAMIDALKPDFLGVCEFEPEFDKAGRLATNEVFSSFPVRVIGPKNRYQSNAIFTRFPCVRYQTVPYVERVQATYFIDAVFMFGTNEVHFVQAHLDWSLKTDELPGPPYDRRYALRQMYQMAERFKDVPHVIISADYNVNQLWHFTPLAKVGFAVANRKKGLLNNVLVKGFDVKETFYADEGHTLSDHQIFGCVLEMHDSDWVEETGGTQGLTGAWAREVGYDMKTLKANLANNIFTPDSPSEGNYVTMDLTTMMCAPAADYEQPAPDAAVQAAVRLSKDLRFQVWTKKQLGVVSGGVGESGWLDVAAEGVVPADDTEYTFRFVFDYARGKYSVSTMGKRGEYRALEAAGGIRAFPLAAQASTVSGVGFTGATVFKSLVGLWERRMPRGFWMSIR